MKRWIAALAVCALLICMLVPSVSYTEDQDTLHLARVIYALARGESYRTKLAIGTVAMNRVSSAWFGDTLKSVLSEQHQFPAGQRYDSESLAAAHAVLAGQRALDARAVYYQSLKASAPRTDEPLAVIGGYAFFADA